MSRYALEVNGVYKSFRLPTEQSSGIKQAFVNWAKGIKGYKEQTVLRDINFKVEKGDFIGIVGRNGSGKSTLLKIISQIYYPERGTVKVQGKLIPFIELGVGFNPELTGRENIYLNGALLGFSHEEVSDMYSEIVEFAELEEFMDQKLKNYSSGMQVRLAFSIAIKAKGDILVLDEVLAVGDEAFQRKCVDVFERYKASKQTIVLVTHDMETVRNFCNKALLINDGEIVVSGNPQKVADEYSRLNLKQIDKEMNKKLNNEADIRVSLSPAESKIKKTNFVVNEEVEVSVEWDKSIKADVVMLDLYKLSGEHVTNYKSNRGFKKGEHTLGGRNQASVVTSLNISPGKYYFNASLRRESDDSEILSSYEVGEFVIVEDWSKTKATWSGLVRLDHEWKI